MQRRLVGRAVGLVLLLLVSTLFPFASVYSYRSTYNGLDLIGANSTTDGSSINVSSSAFTVPANATLSNGWMNVSDNWEMDGGNGTWFEAGVVNHSLNFGATDATSLSHFGNSLSLAPDSDVGWVDDLESLALQFTGFSSETWFVSNISLAPANGSMPSSIPEGQLLAAATTAGGLAAGSNLSLLSKAWDLPQVVNNLSLHLEHWLNVDSTDVATIYAQLDTGQWQELTSFVGRTDSNWSAIEISIDDKIGIDNLKNSTSISFRFDLNISIQSQERPGWFIDALNLTNSGEPTNSWFHGNLNGAYAPNLNSGIVIEGNTSNMNNPLELEIWADWDLEGNANDNLIIEGSLDGTNWTLLYAPPGIPGNGVMIDGIWYYAESNGFKRIIIPVLPGFANNNQVWFRLRIQTDSQVNGGYGISGWEGIFLDDVILHSNRLQNGHHWKLLDNFTSNNSITPTSLNNNSHQWQHVTNYGHNGPTFDAYGFEDSPHWPKNWEIEVETGTRGWTFGQYSGTGPMPGFTSGQIGAGTELGSKYVANMWTHLITPSMHIPENATARLTFENWMCTELNWDGGAVYLSTDEGTTWSHFGQNISGFYDTNSTVNPQSPLYMKGIFDGSNVPSGCFNTHPFNTERADVSYLAGQDVKFRFSFFSDPFMEEWGWYIDDVGLEVDYFESSGNWTSPLIEADDFGYGLLDVRGSIPSGTGVSASVLSSTGAIILENQSLPLNLQSLNWTEFPSIKVRINLNTSDPYKTPVIDKITLGADVHLTKESIGGNWSSTQVSFGGSGNADDFHWNETNYRWQLSSAISSTSIIIKYSFQEHRPIQEYDIRCDCSSVYINSQLINSPTIIHVDRGEGTGSIHFGVTLLNNGWIKSFDVRSRFVGFADNPSIDVGNDTTEEWAWPSRMPHIGKYGFQTYISHADITSENQTQRLNLNSQTATFELTNTSLKLTMLIPKSAIVSSFSNSYLFTHLGSSSEISSATFELDGSGQGQGHGGGPISGINWWGSKHMNGDTVNLSLPQATTFQEYNFFYNVSGHWRIEIHRLMFVYDLVQNVSLYTNELSSKMQQWSIEQNNSIIDIPVNFSADKGSVELDGAIEWYYLIQNDVISAPEAMVPDGSKYTVSTTHEHYDSETFVSYDLRMSPSRDPDEAAVILNLTNPHTSNTGFAQPRGQGLVDWDMANTTITQVDNKWKIDWVFSTRWLWDDQPIIHFMTEAHDAAGNQLGPAIKTVGLTAGNAVENDLEIVNLEITDQYGRDIADPLDSHYPWPVMASSSIDISGQMRFQGSVDSWVDGAEVEILMNQGNFTQQYLVEVVEGNWSTTITLPQSGLVSGQLVNLSAHLKHAGPVDLPSGIVEDATTAMNGTTFIHDTGGPILGTLYALTTGEDQPADGHIWDQSIPLALGLLVEDEFFLGDELILFYWREASDDLNHDNKAQLAEYQNITVQLNFGNSEMIEFPFINVQNFLGNSRISLYVEVNDLAGLALKTGGSAGLEDDLATMILRPSAETTIEVSSFHLDSISGNLLPAYPHHFTFDLQNANGVESIDLIHLDLIGDSENCSIEYRSWSSDPISYDEDCFVSQPIVEFVEGSLNVYSISFEFTLSWDLITIIGNEKHMPSLRVEDHGDDLGLALANLHWLNWSLYDDLELVFESWQDLVPENGSFVDNQLYLQPGDIIDVEWGVEYYGLGIKTGPLPINSNSTIKVLGGLIEMETKVDLGNLNIGIARFSFEGKDFPNGRANIVASLNGMSNYNIHKMDIQVNLDDDSPQITFIETSLIRVRSDSLDGLQVSFNIEDDFGMPQQSMTLNWVFQRNGLAITGAQGQLEVDFVNLGIYYDILNLSGEIKISELRGSDEIIIWIEGRDLAGNPLVGAGSEYEPRRPVWDYIAFSPEVVHISVTPRIAKLGELINIDVQLQNTGTLSGNLTLNLWQMQDEKMVLLDSSETIRLLSGLSFTQSFEHEIAMMGDQQLYLSFDDEENYVPVPLGIVRDSITDDTSSGMTTSMVLGFLGVFILVITGLFVMRPRHSFEDEWEEEDDVPPPPPQEVAPPRPTGLDIVNEEE